MFTIAGFGTMYYGWQHYKDGVSTATKWLVVSWIPLIPLSRYCLKVHTDFKDRRFLAHVGPSPFFPFAISFVDEYQVLERIPLCVREIIRTYFRTFVLGPPLVLWPWLLIWGFYYLIQQNPSWKSCVWPFYVIVGLVAVMFGNTIAVAQVAIRRARGFHGGLFE